MNAEPSALQLAALAACWLAYGALHSALAAFAVKRRVAARWPQLMPAYRLVFNLLAVLLLVPPAWLSFALRGEALWAWHGALGWLADALALAAVGGFLWSLRYYDLGRFGGLVQWKTRDAAVADGERFTLSPLHRWVRHPWYALALVMIWTRDMDAASLVSALCVSLYFWWGSMLEERKLLAMHGTAYARYRQRVNALLPLPGHILDADEARALCALEHPRRE